MKQQYETMLMALESRIVSTQEERDKVLKGMMEAGGGKSAVSQDKLSKIKHDYQEKLEKLLQQDAKAQLLKLETEKKQ